MNRIFPAFVLLGAGVAACSGSREATPTVPSALVEIAPATLRSLELTVSGYGQVEFAPARAAALVVEVESQVVAVLVASGATVHAGDPLLRLRPSAQTALEVDRAVREAALAEGEARRLLQMREEGLATAAEVAAAQVQAGSLARLRDSLIARTGGGHEFLLRAPRDGIVDAIAVQPGDLIAATATAVRLGDPHALQVRIGLEPEDALRVTRGSVVHLSVPQSAEPQIDGHVVSVEHRMDRETRLAAAYVEIPPATTVMPGMQLWGHVVIATRTVVAVPVAALLHEDDATAVYVLTGGRAHRREVTIGIDDGQFAEIKSGLESGSDVVSVGNHELQDGMAVRLAGTGAPVKDPP